MKTFEIGQHVWVLVWFDGWGDPVPGEPEWVPGTIRSQLKTGSWVIYVDDDRVDERDRLTHRQDVSIRADDEHARHALLQ